MKKTINWKKFWSVKALASNNFTANGRSLVSDIGYMHIIAEIVKHLKLEKDSNLSDIGCGTGMISMSLAPWVRSIDAIDISEEMVCRASENLKEFTNVSVNVGTLLNTNLNSEFYDRYLSYSVIQYLKEPDSLEPFLFELNRILKPGGRAFLGANPDPSKRSLYESVVKSTRDIDSAEQELSLLDDILWVDPNLFVLIAKQYDLSVEISALSPQIWNHFYMYNLVVTK